MNKTTVQRSITYALTLALLGIQPAANACTGLMLKMKDGSMLRGRTVEFGVAIDNSIAAVPRGYQFVGQAPNGEGLKYVSKYAALGVIGYKDVKILDGLNEKGLSVGAFYFPGYAQYTTVTSKNQSKALSAGDFPNWVVTQFATVAEVRKAVEAGDVIITPTVLKGWGTEAPPFHYVVYDKTGASIVIEPIDGKLVVHDNPLGVMSNSPTFDWHMTNLKNYISLNPRNAPAVKLDGKVFTQFGQGSGLFGLPGDFTPPSRLVRAAIFSTTAIAPQSLDEGVTQTFHILNNFDIPVGAVREVSEDGIIHTDSTIMTMVSDPNNLRYFYKTYDDQTIRMVEMKKFDPNAKTVKLLSTKTVQPIVDMSDKFE